MHAVLQAPQWAGLLAVSTQVPLQSTVPGGQAHIPVEQILPPAQAIPQPLQFAGSDCRSTHAVPQRAKPVVQGPAIMSGADPSEVARGVSVAGPRSALGSGASN
jgi:hypothetical protein